MIYNFDTPYTIYWKTLNPFSFRFYIPYVKIIGQSWQIDGVRISKFGHKYFLYIAEIKYLESTSLSAVMIKATEILKDLSFKTSDLTFYPTSNLCQINHPIIGWKKAFSNSWGNEIIVNLRVPEGTDCHLTKYKCRAQKAEILGVYDLNLNPLDPETPIYSIYRARHIPFPYEKETSVTHSKYQVGDTLVVDDFCYIHAICSTGIHFFRSPLLAIKYND